MHFDEESLIELANEGEILLEAENENSFEDHWPFRGSALGNCTRQLAMRTQDVPLREYGPKQLRTFKVGHQREDALVAAMSRALRAREIFHRTQRTTYIPTPIEGEEAQRLYQAAFEWCDEDLDRMTIAVREGILCIKGSLDLCILDWRQVYDGEKQDVIAGPAESQPLEETSATIVDIKTKHSFGMKMLEKEGVDSGYGVQLASYAIGLEHEGFGDIGALIYYENKNDQTPKVKAVDPSVWRMQAVHHIEQKSQAMLDWLNGKAADVLPEFFPDEGGALPWQCNYCRIGPKEGKCHEDYHWHNAVSDPLKPAKWVGVPK